MERHSTVLAVLFQLFVALVFSQQSSVLVLPGSSLSNGSILVLPAATVLKANSAVAASVTITCLVRDILPAGSKCIVGDCGNKFRRIDCSNASSADLRSTFQSYVEAVKNASYDDQGPNLPLWVRVAGVSGNLTQDSLGPLSGLTVRKLELVNTNIDNFTASTFGGLRTLTNLDLNGITNDVIPAGAFDSLGLLQVLQVRNMPNLRVLEKGALEAIWDRNKSVCVNLDISSDSFVCDCDNNIWIQQTLLAKANKVNVGTVAQVYSDNSTSVTPCGVNVVCSQKSPADFRHKLMDINVNVTCANVTKTAKMDNAVAASTVSVIKVATANGAGETPNGLWVTSLLAVLCGILARF